MFGPPIIIPAMPPCDVGTGNANLLRSRIWISAPSEMRRAQISASPRLAAACVYQQKKMLGSSIECAYVEWSESCLSDVPS